MEPPRIGKTTYDTVLATLDIIFSEDLEATCITVSFTDAENCHGYIVAVAKSTSILPTKC